MDEIPAGDYLKAAEDHRVAWGRKQPTFAAADARKDSVFRRQRFLLCKEGEG